MSDSGTALGWLDPARNTRSDVLASSDTASRLFGCLLGGELRRNGISE